MRDHIHGRAGSLGTLSASHITKHYGSQLVLDDVSVVVGRSDRIGVVGPNGGGKSTLLRILAGLEAPDSGTVVGAPSGLAVGYLPQEFDAHSSETVMSYLARRTGVKRAEEEMNRLADAMGDDRDRINAYSKTLERFLMLGGDDLEARASVGVARVGVPPDRLKLPTTSLSGGQAARISLAAIMLARFDIFLLDEPTNNLDFSGLELLEEFLEGLSAGVVVVSHDRAFLDRCIDRVLELDEGTHRSTEHSGGWSEYARARELERIRRYEAYEQYVSRRVGLMEQARRQRQRAEAGKRKAKTSREPDKNIRFGHKEGAENSAAKVRGIDRSLARLESVEKPWEGWRLSLVLAPVRRSGDIVVRLEDAVVQRGVFRLGPLNLEIRWRDRVAILGSNGSGKTTLLNALLGTISLASGRRYQGTGVVIGEMDQHRVTFSGDEPLLEIFRREAALPQEQARSLLAKFGLTSDHIDRSSDSLSPGERSRAVLALFMAREVNFLVLDEPTNHLDLPAIEELEQALGTFRGTVVLVTHDRRFLESFGATRTIPL